MTHSRNKREGRWLGDRFPQTRFGQYRYTAKADRITGARVWDYSDPAAPVLVKTVPLAVETTRDGLMRVTVGFRSGDAFSNYPSREWYTAEGGERNKGK